MYYFKDTFLNCNNISQYLGSLFLPLKKQKKVIASFYVIILTLSQIIFLRIA